MRRAAVLAVLLVLGCKNERPRAPPGVLTLTGIEQQATWIRNFNPLLPIARWPAPSGIYEPLAVFNSATGVWVPWLATAWEWRDEGKTLSFTLREHVQWSDGQPFTVDDVLFTFDLIKRFPALDQKAVWSFLSKVEAGGPNEVLFRFSRVLVPRFSTLAHLPLVPKHTWSAVADPVTFTNPTPVATGPFTEVRLFQNQVYELGRNPHYWQPGKPAVEAIRLPAFPGNDQANLALVDGELDWAANYVPAVERVFVRKNPVDHHYWFPPLGGTIFLYANTTRAPFTDVRVRRALSQAIDRATVVEVAMSHYTEPADATGLSAIYESWRDPATAARYAGWMTFDAKAAALALDEAGIRLGPDGHRVLPSGKPFAPTLSVVNGWSDWVRAAQVIARGFKAIGVEVNVKLLDRVVWQQRMQEGDFDLSIAWSLEGTTPYEFYRWLMHPDTVVPEGKVTVGNWHRFGSPTARPIFDELERTTDPVRERELEVQLQEVFAQEVPAIPLFPNPSWGEFNTRRFTGFPDAKNPWATLSPNKQPDCLLVLTELRPVQEVAP
jgi:peptide/nickel transport system substrate-binding protein